MLPRTVLKEVIKAAEQTAEECELNGEPILAESWKTFASRLFYNNQVPHDSLSERQ